MKRIIGIGAATAILALAASPAAMADAEPTVCDGVIANASVGDLLVPYGASCTVDGSYVSGSITTETDAGSLTIRKSLIDGDVQVDSSHGLRVDRAVVTGELRVVEPTAAVELTTSAFNGAASIQAPLATLTVGGDEVGRGNVFGAGLRVRAAFGATAIERNVVRGDLAVDGGRAATRISRNLVSGALGCAGNDPAPTGGGNLAGSSTGQCSAL